MLWGRCPIPQPSFILLSVVSPPLPSQPYSSGKQSWIYSALLKVGRETNARCSHTHQDQIQIFYDYLPSSLSTSPDSSDSKPKILRDTTQIDITKPLQLSY